MIDGRSGGGRRPRGDRVRAAADPGEAARGTETGPPETNAYPPIEEYALVGDCHGAALVSRHGSVDWCALGRFDADPVFCRILDARKGGYLSIRPAGAADPDRAYLPSTNILRTTFRTPDGRIAVTDFMPVGRMEGSSVHDYVTLAAPFWLVRIVEGLEGRVRVRAAYRPTVAFAARVASLERTADGLAAARGPFLASDLGWSVEGDEATASFELGRGERRILVVAPEPVSRERLEGRVERSLEITRAFWEEWAGYCRYDGPYREAVRRSALTLKMLTYAPSGAIVAAPTTSLPETIGGVRNWDYRFCWLRDASFTLYALSALGYSGEADDFSEFLVRACAAGPHLQVLYGIGGETRLEERTLDGLEGYRGSAPVRIGNAAADQRQLDIYGQVLDWAWLYRRLGARFDGNRRAVLRDLAASVVEHWNEPGEGIWEARGEPRHYTYGKVMAWVALDRAIRLLGGSDERVRAREEIRRSVLERGVDPGGGHFRQAYGEDSADAALLLVPMVGFPADRRTLERTVRAIERELRSGDFVYRYRSADGLPGDEGAFLICSFWLVDALLLLDRGEEARALFERLLECANDVGLYSEEIDPGTGEFLGNFPQAFTHLALIQAAVNLELHAERGAGALQGSHADRARHAVEATRGLRALWAAFKRTGRVGRLLSSRDSIMPREWQASSAPADWRLEARIGGPVPRVILSPFGPGAADRSRAGDRSEEADRPDGVEGDDQRR